jgi:hypothetical protein
MSIVNQKAAPRQADNSKKPRHDAAREKRPLKRGVLDPLGPSCAMPYLLPPGPGVEPLRDHANVCPCVFCRWLSKPRLNSISAMITRHPRMVASVAVLQPDTHSFSFDNDVEFRSATRRLQAIDGVDITKLHAERGSVDMGARQGVSREHVTAVEQMAMGRPHADLRL